MLTTLALCLFVGNAMSRVSFPRGHHVDACMRIHSRIPSHVNDHCIHEASHSVSNIENVGELRTFWLLNTFSEETRESKR